MKYDKEMDGNPNKIKLFPTGVGTVTITATSNSNEAVKKDCVITISNSKPATPVEAVVLNHTSLSMQVGGTETLSATVKPGSVNQAVTWSKAGDVDAIIFDSTSGEIAAKKAGSVTITATSVADTTKSGSCSIVISEESGEKLSGLTIAPYTMTLKYGGPDGEFTYERQPASSTEKIVWTSAPENMVEISDLGGSPGKVRIKVVNIPPDPSNPDVTITASSIRGDVLMKCRVKIDDGSVRVRSLTLDTHNKTIVVGETFKLEYNLDPSTATVKTVSWISKPSEIASVDDEGNVQGLKAGTALISVISDDISKASDCCTVKVVNEYIPLNSISIKEAVRDTVTVYLGERLQLHPIFNPDDATDKDVIWTTGYSSGVKIEDKTNGIIHALQLGGSTVTVSSVADPSIYANVVVNVVSNQVQWLGLDKTACSVKVNETVRIKAMIYPEDATDSTVKWNSSDPSTATVDNSGNVKGIKPGEVTITAKSASNNEISASCTVKVLPAEVSGGGSENVGFDVL